MMEFDTEFEDTESETEDTENETEDTEGEAEDSAYENWKQELRDLGSPLDEETLEALWADPRDRSWRQTELADEALHPEYETQRSFLASEETGELLEVPYGTKGSQRPDGIFFPEEGPVSIRELKTYHDCESLLQNIEAQTADRRALFGEDADICYVISSRFNLGELDRIQGCCEALGVDWELQYK